MAVSVLLSYLESVFMFCPECHVCYLARSLAVFLLLLVERGVGGIW